MFAVLQRALELARSLMPLVPYSTITEPADTVILMVGPHTKVKVTASMSTLKLAVIKTWYKSGLHRSLISHIKKNAEVSQVIIGFGAKEILTAFCDSFGPEGMIRGSKQPRGQALLDRGMAESEKLTVINPTDPHYIVEIYVCTGTHVIVELVE